MKLLVLSDLHGHVSLKKFCNMLDLSTINGVIICGDITHFGTLKLAESILKESVLWDIPLLFVPGNCDPKELASINVIDGALNLHGRCRKIDNLSFIGVGGSTSTPARTPFELSEKELGDTVHQAYKELEDKKHFILVSHTPLINSKVDKTAFGTFVGSKALREFVEETRPTVMVCGHIHEAKGTDKVGETLIVNPGPAHKGFYAIVKVNGHTDAEMKHLE